MFIVYHYAVAVAFCIVTMLCWGSWGNTQKLAQRNWRYEYFYWDYVIGVLLFSVLGAVTLGSIGSEGRSFFTDLQQATCTNLALAFTGGVVFNAANILLAAAISICGMAVAFPVGIGLALVLGVLINYMGASKGDPFLLFTGAAFITLAIVFSGLAYRSAARQHTRLPAKGLLLSILAGIIMSCFYRFIAAAMDMDNFAQPAPGKMTPYTALVIFAVGVLVSNFPFSFIARSKPVAGTHIPLMAYFKGSAKSHLVGIAGGCIWCLGTLFSLLASAKAGAAISYGLGQGATLVSALWGIFVWKEFAGAPPSARRFNVAMFLMFLIGLGLLIYAGM